jgi:glucose/arabinose dehydrogenase
LALFCPLVASATAATLPPGFSESVVAGGLKSPTAMAVAPDGRLFVCEQGGQLRVVSAAGALLAAPFTTLTVDSNGERGLLGIAFDPGFATNQFVYVYYTATAPVTHNRVSRFTANGDVAVAGSEVAILDLDPLSSATNHNGGAIHFGPDGKLYVAVGENANGNNSQSLANRLGKMLRIGADGSIPVDNPFYATAVGANRSIWALGLRNPFTFAFQRFTGAMFINDVGQNTWEEIDLGRAGANYGWPTTEGYTNDPRFQTPFYEYDHSNACAISGGDFYTPLTTRFPAQYSGAYFFGDYCGGWIHLRDPGTGAVTNFADGISFLVDVTVSQDGGLYYLAQHGGANSTGVVVRVDYAGAPTVTVTANGSHGPLVLAPGDPLTIAVSFALGSAPTLNPAELYIGVGTRFGTFWMDPVSHLFLPAVVPAFTGPLAAFGPTTVVNVRNVSSLPPGPYWWVVAVDNDSNGLLNAVFYDVVETTVP